MYSSSSRGRRPASYCASSSTRAAVTRRSLLMDAAGAGGYAGPRGSVLPGKLTQRLLQRTLESTVRLRLDRGLDGFLGERPMIPQVHERGEHIIAHRGRLRQRHFRPDAPDRDQALEDLLLEQRRETVQDQRVFANVRVNPQRRLAPWVT